MQEAYRPATPRTKEQNLLFEPGHTVVMWTPEDLNLSNRRVGLQSAKGRNFLVLTDQVFRVRDTSERIFSADPGENQGIVNEAKYAHLCAYEILLAHSARGVAIIDSLCDTSPAKVQLFEDRLRAKGWFDVPRLQDMIQILDEFVPSDYLEEEAVTALRVALERTIEYRSARLDDSIQEAEQAKKENGIGRSNLTRTERAYYAEIGFDLPEMLSQPVQNMDKVTEAQPMGQVNQIREVTAAIAVPFAEAMNEAFAKFTSEMMKRVDERLTQKGVVEDGNEENNEETGTRRRGRPAKAEAQAA